MTPLSKDTKQKQPIRKRGRPPTGVNQGKPAKMSEYSRLSLFIEPDLRSEVEALAAMKAKPVWQIIDEALRKLIDDLSSSDKQFLMNLKQLRAKNLAETQDISRAGD